MAIFHTYLHISRLYKRGLSYQGTYTETENLREKQYFENFVIWRCVQKVVTTFFGRSTGPINGEPLKNIDVHWLAVNEERAMVLS